MDLLRVPYRLLCFRFWSVLLPICPFIELTNSMFHELKR